jgi:hypothetical protein
MADKIKLVQGDTKPQIKCVVSDATTGAIVDLSGSTVRLRFRAVGSTTLMFTLTGYLQAGLEDSSGVVTLDQAGQAYAVVGKGGRVAFQFEEGNLATAVGSYEGELEVTFPSPNAGVQTVYETIKFQVRSQF